MRAFLLGAALLASTVAFSPAPAVHAQVPVAPSAPGAPVGFAGGVPVNANTYSYDWSTLPPVVPGALGSAGYAPVCASLASTAAALGYVSVAGSPYAATCVSMGLLATSP